MANSSPNTKSGKMYDALEQAAYRAEHDGNEAVLQEFEDWKNRGKTTLAIAQISKEGLDEKIHGRAIEMTDAWEKAEEDKRIKEKAARKGITEAELRKRNAERDARWGKLPVINIPYFLVKGIASAPSSIRRTIELSRNSRKLREEGFSEEEQQSLAERVAIASEDGAVSEDTDVANLSERNKDSDEYKAIKAFTATVATAGKGKKASEMIEEARKETLERLSKTSGGATTVDLAKIEHDLRGALAGKGKNEKSREKVLDAIDKYLDKHVSIVSADVKTGLAAKEVYDKLKDRATVEHGVFAGMIVGLGTSLVGLARSKAIQNVAGPGLVQHGLKVGVAGVFGAIKAGSAEKKRQQKAMIDAAVNHSGRSERATKDKYEVISADMTTQLLKERTDAIAKLIGEGKNLDREEYAANIGLIAEIRNKIRLQNYGIQIFSYDGRQNIEKSKLEMFKALSGFKKALHEIAPSHDVEKDIKHDMEDNEHVKALNEEVESIQKTQKSERRNATIKGGLTAALTAAAIDQIFHHKAIWEDFKNTKAGQAFINSEPYKRVSGAFVGTSSAAASGEVATASATEQGITYENHERIDERFMRKPVIIEDDPDGNGMVVAIDADGDGKITAADKLLRGSLEKDGVPGVNLTDEDSINSLNGELAKYNIQLEHEAITPSKYGESTVSNYIERSRNAVDNSGGVDWSRSVTKVGIGGNPMVVSADGMTHYEIPVTGTNGYSIPDGAKLFIDLDGDNGSGKALEYTIQNGRAIVPADVVDTSMVGSGGVARLMGTVRVGEMDGNQMISYGTIFGQHVSLSDTISASTETSGYAFTAIDTVSGERLSQFAVDANNNIISNMSEIFNGIQTTNYEHLPATIKVNDIDSNQSNLVLARGGTIKDFDVQGGYHAEYDAFENVPFKADGSDTYLGTPISWDLDGDGAMSIEEEVQYVKQMFVRTATNPYMLGQNASNYGILEPSRLANLGISQGTLIKWGITDGVIDSEEELNTFLRQLKLPENANLWDKVANETINEMETQLQGANFEVETVNSRLSTFANSNRAFDTAGASTPRTAIYAYRAGANGEKTYVGNQGWWCRKYGGSSTNLKVGDMPRCEQKCIIQGSTPTGPSTPVTPVTPPTPPTPLTPKNPDAEIRNAGNNVVQEYVVTPASPLSQSPYEVDSNNIYEHTVSTEESAANAVQAAIDASAAAEAAIEGDRIVKAIEQAPNQEVINNIGADLWRQFQGGQ